MLVYYKKDYNLNYIYSTVKKSSSYPQTDCMDYWVRFPQHITEWLFAENDYRCII